MEDCCFDEKTVMLLKAVYGAVFCFGFLANVVTLFSMLKRRSRLPIHVYTLHLSVCDIFMLCLYVPTQMVLIDDQLDWKMGVVVCKLVNIILPVTLICTVGTLLAINLDTISCLAHNPDYFSSSVILKLRCRPYILNLLTPSVKKAQITMVVIWSFSFLINLPLVILPKLLVEIIADKTFTACIEGFPNQKTSEIYWIIMFVIAFCLPLLCLIGSYWYLSHYASKVKRRGERRHHQKIADLGVWLAVVFFLCTGCQHLFFFMNSSFIDVKISIRTKALLYVISNFFVVLQAAVNPLIYGKFRHIYLHKEKGDKKRIITPNHVRVKRRRFPNGTEMLYIKNEKRKSRGDTIDHLHEYSQSRGDTIDHLHEYSQDTKL